MESEKDTRRDRIDPRLRAAHWDIQPASGQAASSSRALTEYPTETGPADYVLVDGEQVVGAVEAKKLSTGTESVLGQAERYSKGISQLPVYENGFHIPFLYSTNGPTIWYRDARSPLNLQRELAGFHTPEALKELLDRDFNAEVATLTSLQHHPRLHEFQKSAIDHVENAITSRKRRMLVAMATGTGKTITTVSQVYRALKSGLARRVLFLVDRRALAAQAVRAFNSFEAEPGLKFSSIYPVYSQRFQRDDVDGNESWDTSVLPSSLLTHPKVGDSFVYVCTVQRMSLNLFGRDFSVRPDDETDDDAEEKLDIPIHGFDLVIADECHRGYSAQEISVWRSTLDYFDSIKIGLTATPAAHTIAYFGHLAFKYEYDRAVREGFLVDYDVARINSGVRMNGVFLRAGEQVDKIDPTTGLRSVDLLEDERGYQASDVEKVVSVPSSNRKILEEIKLYALAHEASTGRFPKTLIFAANDLPHTSHSDELVRLAQQVFDRGYDFVEKITGSVDRPLQKIREFRNRSKPGIVVSVDLMSTGVDIPDLEYIVFLRQVRSRILFEQMLGRGTRRGDRFPSKEKFVVFDCFDGTLVRYFKSATGMTVQEPSAPTRSIAEIVDDIWQNRDRDQNVQALIKRLRRVERTMSGPAYDLFARFIPDGDVGNFASMLPMRVKTNFVQTMKLLRDEEFLDLLVNYPRPQRQFTVATSIEDSVESGWLIRDGLGNELKPDDYLAQFVEFVRGSVAEIGALAVLLRGEGRWSPSAFEELRASLRQAPGNFTEEKLQKAFAASLEHPLVDLISMIKRSMKADVELLTAEQRVDTAIDRVTTNISLTDDQQSWMHLVRAHLLENMSLDREDFNLVPVFADRGGLGKANSVFAGKLDDIIAVLNEEIVAA